jgi:hypothetical protein
MKKFLDKYLKKRMLKSEEFRKSYDEEGLKIEIALKIKQMRDELQMTQQEFAEHVGVHRSTISKIESRDTNVSLVMLHSIADKCGYDFSFDLTKRERS